MSGQSEAIEWWYITPSDYQKLLDAGVWSTSGTNPFEPDDFTQRFPNLGNYYFAKKSDVDDEEEGWAISNDIVLKSASFAESNQSGVVL